MRRILSFILLGLGVFAVALGLLLRFYAYPQLAKIPLDQESISVAEGHGITALVIETVDGGPSPEIRENLSLTSTTYVTGDLTAPEVEEGGDVGVYVEAIKTVDDASGVVVAASVRSLCVDRFTNEAVLPCEAQYIEQEQGKREASDRNTLQQPGQSLKFPFGTEPRDYQYFDLTVRESIDARYEGTENIKGLDVYKFVMNVPPTKIADREVPGPLIGEEEPSVTAELFYEVERTVWVEPETGIVIRGAQDMKQELVTGSQSPGGGTIVFEGTLAFKETTVNDNVVKAEDNKSKLTLLTTWPVYMWIGGGVLILAGALLLMTANSAAGRRGAGGGASLRRQPAHAEN